MRWQKIDSRRGGDYKVFRVRADHAVSPETGDEHVFYIMEASDWVNVIPITSDGKILFVKQYRHGTERVTLEIPGGVIDDGESPLEAARREMIEETGYDSHEIVLLGSTAPNPAIQNNRCYSYLAMDARYVGEQRLDPAELIDVQLIDPADVSKHVLDDEVTHALVIAAFYLYEAYAKTSDRALPRLL